MRIIAGTYRSRRLAAPPGLATRPTSDRLRETLFNVLAPSIQGAFFLDLYAGSGAVGLEALSRGAASVTFVERAPAALKVLRTNLATLGIDSGFHVYEGSVAAYLRSSTKASPKSVPRAAVVFPRVLAFLDPPYDAAKEYEVTLGMVGGVLSEGAVVIAEHRRKERLEDRYGALARTRILEQGDAALSFYELHGEG